MKNYVQIKPAVKSKPTLIKVATLSKINPFQSPKTPVLSPKVSLKTIGSLANSSKQTTGLKMCRSVKQIVPHYQVESEQLAQMNMLGLDEGEQLFGESSFKTKGARPFSSYKSIEEELAEVLEVIRVQKTEIEQQIKILKRKHDDYKRICEGKQLGKVEYGVNREREEVEQTIGVLMVDRSVGCDLLEKRRRSNKVQETDSSDQGGGQRSREIYLKLQKLLQEINVDPKKVLPDENLMREQINMEEYEILTQKRMVEIQKYFIYKILQKIKK